MARPARPTKSWPCAGSPLPIPALRRSCKTLTSLSGRANSPPSWAPTAAARPPCSSSSGGCWRPRPARSGEPPTPGPASSSRTPTTRSSPKKSGRRWPWAPGSWASPPRRSTAGWKRPWPGCISWTGPGDDPFSLTKGQRQCLAVAGVLALAPRVIILDEPTTGLDFREQQDLLDLVSELHAQARTIIMVTHSMWAAATYAQRLVVLKDGQVLLDGPTREVLAQEEILSAARLRPPAVVRLSRRSGFSGADARGVSAADRGAGRSQPGGHGGPPSRQPARWCVERTPRKPSSRVASPPGAP